MVGRVATKDIRGLKTGWITAGNPKGPIIIMLHGYPDTPESWSHQIKEFEKDFHIVAPYTRGARPSESTNDLSRYDLNSTTLDLLEILKEEDPTRSKDIYCIGHDMGTLQAWNLCPLLGEKIKGLVIINGLSMKQAISRLKNPSQLKKSWYIYLLLLPVIPSILARRFPAKILKLANDLGKLPPQKRSQLSAALMGVVDPIKQYKAIARNLPTAVTEAIRQSVPRLNTPVLIIYGNKDPFLEQPRRDEFLSESRNLTVRIVEGAHWPHRENPDVINNLLKEFFKCT